MSTTNYLKEKMFVTGIIFNDAKALWPIPLEPLVLVIYNPTTNDSQISTGWAAWENDDDEALFAYPPQQDTDILWCSPQLNQFLPDTKDLIVIAWAYSGEVFDNLRSNLNISPDFPSSTAFKPDLLQEGSKEENDSIDDSVRECIDEITAALFLAKDISVTAMITAVTGKNKRLTKLYSFVEPENLDDILDQQAAMNSMVRERIPKAPSKKGQSFRPIVGEA